MVSGVRSVGGSPQSVGNVRCDDVPDRLARLGVDEVLMMVSMCVDLCN
jgi:hypothetical protein